MWGNLGSPQHSKVRSRTGEKGESSSQGGGMGSRERGLRPLTPHLDSILEFNWPAGERVGAGHRRPL